MFYSLQRHYASWRGGRPQQGVRKKLKVELYDAVVWGAQGQSDNVRMQAAHQLRSLPLEALVSVQHNFSAGVEVFLAATTAVAGTKKVMLVLYLRAIVFKFRVEPAASAALLPTLFRARRHLRAAGHVHGNPAAQQARRGHLSFVLQRKQGTA